MMCCHCRIAILLDFRLFSVVPLLIKCIHRVKCHIALFGTQVAERALEIWGSDEKLEEERERRSANKDKLKKKKFDKKVNGKVKN